MFPYDKTLEPYVVLCHCDLILQFSDLAFYLGTQLVYDLTYFFHSRLYDTTFGPKVVLCHCDLISWFSDRAHILTLSWYICILLSDFE